MEQYIIKGGNPLVGEVEIGGAKNAALAILAAAIMTDETVLIDNLPDVNDINVLLEAIQGILLSFGCDARKVQESRSGSAGRMQYRKQTDRSASEGIPRIGCGCGY